MNEGIKDLNDIRIFAAVGAEGTLSAAAAKLRLPASTISRAVTRLETDLGILLVRRSSRGLTLTDSGREYLQVCRRALRALREGSDVLSSQRDHPSGLIKVACPITMARFIFAPLLKTFLERYPELRVEIEPYSSGWDQEPREEIDVFFKVRAPRDSMRRVRNYPGVRRGLFATAEYLKARGTPSQPDELISHSCIGSGSWQLRRGKATASPSIPFRIVTSDPSVHLDVTLQGFGIAVLPLYMQSWPQAKGRLIPVLQGWHPASISLCALFTGQSRLTPKVQVLLDFLSKHIGTNRDPRLYGASPKGLFTDSHRNTL